VAQPPVRRVGPHQHAAAVDEGHQAEVDRFLAGQRPAGRAALEVDLALAHRIEPVLYRERDPARLELRQLQAAAKLARDALAQLDRIAYRLAVAQVGEGDRAVDVAERERAALADLVERRRLRE